jgi:hypothetical protein
VWRLSAPSFVVTSGPRTCIVHICARMAPFVVKFRLEIVERLCDLGEIRRGELLYTCQVAGTKVGDGENLSAEKQSRKNSVRYVPL